MKHQEILLKLLEVTDNTKDSFQFLKLFRSIKPEKFAVIYADSGTLMESAEALLYNLKLLHKLDLYPVVVLDKDGISYTNLFYRNHNKEESPSILPGKLFRHPRDLAGAVVSALSEKKLPVFVAEEKGPSLFTFLTELCSTLRTKKLVHLYPRGGIFREGNKISIFDVDSSVTPDPEDVSILFSCLELYKNVKDKDFGIAITSASSLLKELFTIKGSGTLIRRKNRIDFIPDHRSISRDKLNLLIEKAFQRSLKENFWNQEFSGILLESEYKGCALIKKTPFGTFLSKFAVDEIARGEGVGRDIWDEMIRKFPILFWRARKENTISKWYTKVCDGMQKEGIWIYFWIGVQEEHIPSICFFLRNHPQDLSSDP
ncbi:acetylglutamate kinase [Leptospira santarosai]|uniref:acetylglutamate kinase n=1 Tax=Leptospira santarosai TaxID=28183 RepID=UPI00062D6976|nr:acetylglutamate kinase [Leptospira santarosai]ASV11278.1 acetylglutamate kinase [Leptospira santarosai]AVV49875.1 PF04768 family protein [Leptospira santarosai]AVV79375.1 PF04768 family protein [Leptospira santarosai]MDO6384248.1 acetylglutamate kinase [Leptospira santarosai]ONF87806.1 acetylglutamate kinase [Leptospira santarosai serovar Grippotyphosa]